MGGRLAVSAAAGDWRIAGASVAGSRHAGSGCEDAHRFSLTDAGVVVAVADGAGSAIRGGDGATVAVQAAHEVMLAAASSGRCQSPDGWRSALSDAFEAAHEAVVTTASDVCLCARATPGDFATTLVIAVVSAGTIAAAQIGDGAVVVDDGVDVSVVLAPERSEYLNETTFLTSSSWRDHVATFVGPAAAVLGMAVLTDGLQLLAFDLSTGRPYSPFFRPFYRLVASGEADCAAVAAFLDSERVNARTDDDKTLVVAARG